MGRGVGTVIVAGALGLLMIWAGLTSSSGSVALGLLVIVALGTIARLNLVRAGLWATYAAAITNPWNGWHLAGHLRPGLLFIMIALICLVAASIRERLPHVDWWLQVLAATVVVVAIVNQLFPTDPRYLAARDVSAAAGQTVDGIVSNLGVAWRFVLSILGVAIICLLCTRHERRAPKRIAIALTLGCSVSGLIAFTDDSGLTALSSRITGVPLLSGRQSGLTAHPNYLANTSVLTIAIAIWLITCKGRDRLVGLLLAPGLLLGVYASGSRGGAICTVVAVVAVIAVIPRFRTLLPTILAAGVTAWVILFLVVPSSGHALLVALRFAGDTNAAASDQARLSVLNQGIADFEHSPFHGIGLQAAEDAHNVYLQTLASGGVLMFAGYMFFVIGAAVAAARAMRVSELARPLFASVAGLAAFNALENSLTQSYMYFIYGLIAAVGARDLAEAPDRTRVGEFLAQLRHRRGVPIAT